MKKKVIIFFIIVLTIILGVDLNEQKKVLYEEGKYIGIGQGNHGEIKVQVTTNKYKIVEINILQQEETPGLCDIVYDEIPKSVLKVNSPDVKVVSGASYTSKGLIDAIKDAVNKAKIKENE